MDKNVGGPEFRVQNQFTKYLQVAVIRTRERYLKKKWRQQNEELSYDQNTFVMQSGYALKEISDTAFITDIETAFELNSLLDQLPDRARSIVRMRICDKYEFEEISQMTGITYANVRNIYYRTLRNLRRNLDEYNYY